MSVNSECDIRISIVIPSFNQGQFLRQALTSIVEQDWRNTEILIADGGSSDETVQVIREFEDSITWWVSEPDNGQGDALNKGLKQATGQLIGFIGADDVFLPGTFQNAAMIFGQDSGCGAVVGGFVRIDEAGRNLGHAVPARVPDVQPCDLMLEPLGTWRLHQVATFFTANALDKVGRYVYEELCYVLDRELLNRVCRQFRVVTSEQVYAGFRQHEKSKSVAHIIPFSEELAALHLRDVPADEDAFLARIRRSAFRHQRVRGYMKLARVHGAGPRAAGALIRVLFIDPTCGLRYSYLVVWADAFGFSGAIRRLVRRFRGMDVIEVKDDA